MLGLSGCAVRLRKTLNSIKAIDFLVLEQKRTMKRLAQDHKNGVSGVKPKYNFCMTQVQACERKKRQLIENVEQMNSIVLAQQFPIFNFPRPVWHIHNEPYIKVRCMVVSIAFKGAHIGDNLTSRACNMSRGRRMGLYRSRSQRSRKKSQQCNYPPRPRNPMRMKVQPVSMTLHLRSSLTAFLCVDRANW